LPIPRVSVRSSCEVIFRPNARILKRTDGIPPLSLQEETGALVAMSDFMNPKAESLKKRTHDFFMRVIGLCRTVARNTEGTSISAQLVDAAGSTDSNYGAACKGRTRKQFIDKVGIAAEEADESKRWLEALRDAGLGNRDEVVSLIKEADELTAIFVRSHKTAQQRLAEAERQKAEEKAARRRNGQSPM
jgi:four helix bundle protein